MDLKSMYSLKFEYSNMSRFFYQVSRGSGKLGFFPKPSYAVGKTDP